MKKKLNCGKLMAGLGRMERCGDGKLVEGRIREAEVEVLLGTEVFWKGVVEGIWGGNTDLRETSE